MPGIASSKIESELLQIVMLAVSQMTFTYKWHLTCDHYSFTDKGISNLMDIINLGWGY